MTKSEFKKKLEEAKEIALNTSREIRNNRESNSKKYAEIKFDLWNVICTVIVTLLIGVFVYVISRSSYSAAYQLIIALLGAGVIFFIGNIVLKNAFFLNFISKI